MLSVFCPTPARKTGAGKSQRIRKLRPCGCCGEKLLGDIVSCPGCGQQVHAGVGQGSAEPLGHKGQPG